MGINVAAHLRLMLVTDDRVARGRDLIALCQAAERGGVTSIQARLKGSDARELLAFTRMLLATVAVPVLVNDRLDVALAAGAAGVHLGPDDLPVALARRLTPPGFLIGASVGSSGEIGLGLEADYWGVGPLHRTVTKSDAGTALGLEGFQRLAGQARVPVLAIGGVRPEDVEGVLRVGGTGVAVISGILAEPDSEGAARRYADQFALARRS